MSESYRLRNLSGWINLQGLQLAQIPEPWRDRTTKLVRGQVPIPTRMSILQSADCIQMGRLTVAAAGSDYRAPVGSLRLHGSRTSPFSDENEHLTIRRFDPDGSTYRVCSWLRFPSSGGIIPLIWFEDKSLFRRE